MTIRHYDGQFALDCWEDPEREDVEAVTEYSDSLPDLRSRAEVILSAGRFRYLSLSRWSATDDDWDEIEVFEHD